jgi:hypothetical protein
VSVRDLAVHGDDLVIATHGRGFWILDNIAPLRQVDERCAATDVVLYRPSAAVRMNPEAFFGSPFPPEEPKAQNPPDGAIVDFYLRTAPAGDVTLEILDAKGEVVRAWSSKPRPKAPRRPGAVAEIWIAPPSHLTARPGMNRFAWDLRYGGPGEESAMEGPQVLPGNYTVRLTAAGPSSTQRYTQPLKVTLDPRSTAAPAELQKRFDLSISIWRDMNRAAEASREGAALRRALAGQRESAAPEMAAKLSALDADAARILGAGGGGRGGRGGAAGGGTTIAGVTALMATALGVAESADRTPPATAYEIARQASRDLATLLANWKTLRDTRFKELNLLH